MKNENKASGIMNLPNILSLVRMALVPVFVCTLLYLPSIGAWNCIIPALVFAVTSFTDMLDGKIARKYDLITDFGKFIDPLADKFMVLSTCVAILVAPAYAEISGLFLWLTVLVLFRELAVTSLRLVVASKRVVVAASLFGKAKTCTQIGGIIIILMEPCFGSFGATHILAYISMAAMAVTTVGSGYDYFRSFAPYLTGKKD